MNSQLATIGTTISANSTAMVQPSVGGVQVGRNTVGYYDVHHWWNPTPTYHYTYLGERVQRPNPTETAFKIVAKLMQEGIVEELTVKKFVKLVDDVATIVKES